MMPRSIGWPILIIASAIAAGLSINSAVAPLLRTVVIFWFLLICPGMAFVRFFRVGGPVTELVIAVALSLAITTLVSETMLYVGAWSPRLGLFVLMGLSIIVAAFQLIAWRQLHDV